MRQERMLAAESWGFILREESKPYFGRSRAVGGNGTIIGKARALRQGATNAEKKIWGFLSRKQMGGYKFRRQHPMGGKYIADFICLEKKNIIELDGSQHADRLIYDDTRDGFLASEGYTVLRFSNMDVFKNTQGVLDMIYAVLHIPHDSASACGLASSAPPQGGSEGAGA